MMRSFHSFTNLTSKYGLFSKPTFTEKNVNSILSFSTQKLVLPEKAKFVIIGGGAIGCATAYQLALNGWGYDTILLEQNELTSGTSWHAAGIVSERRDLLALINMVRNSRKMFQSFVDPETKINLVGWHRTGSLSVVRDDEGLRGLEEQYKLLQLWGVECQLLTPKECKERHPLLDHTKIVGGLYLPNDGIVNPWDACRHYAKLAKEGGVKIIEGCAVTDFKRNGTKIEKVITERGAISAEFIISAAGMWSRQLGDKMGVKIPIASVPHQYVFCKNVAGMGSLLPILRDLKYRTYIKPDVKDTAVIGQFEETPGRWECIIDGKIPRDTPYALLPDDLDRALPSIEAATELLPVMQASELRSVTYGPDSHSVDNHFLLGTPKGTDNLIVAAGFNSHGIMASGGLGIYLTKYILSLVNGQPHNLDEFSVMDINRVAPEIAASDSECERLARETYAHAYKTTASKPIANPGRRFR